MTESYGSRLSASNSFGLVALISCNVRYQTDAFLSGSDT